MDRHGLEEPRALSPGREHGSWSTARGSVTTWVLAPGVLVSRGQGHLDTELAGHIVESGDAVIARYGTLVAFHDWQKIETYDSNARARLTSWDYRIRQDVERVHILVASKLVKMGVSVASLVLVGMIVAYDDRSRFEVALRETLHRT